MISLVIPAYNEEGRISNVLKLYEAFLSEYGDYEIIVVVDGNDRTAIIVKEFSKINSNIKLFEYSKRLGKGGALANGFVFAQGEIIGFVDSDLAVLPEEYKKLIDALDSADCIIASRRLEGAYVKVKQPWTRRFFSISFNYLIRAMFFLNISDTQCGAKVFRKKPLKKILRQLRSTGFEFDVELLWRIKKGGFVIREIPISWSHEDGSNFGFKFIPMMFWNLLMRRIGA
jgi:glycosyltransferase involved in cell wall biosynthesis